MGITAVLEQERAQITATFDAVEEIEGVAAGLPASSGTKLRAVAQSLVGHLSPVRAVIAADLLGVSVKTVRKWAGLGMLREVKTRSRVLHVDAAHLHEVLHLVHDLRAAGKENIEFFRQLQWKMEDRDLLATNELQEGLRELRDGADLVEL